VAVDERVIFSLGVVGFGLTLVLIAWLVMGGIQHLLSLNFSTLLALGITIVLLRWVIVWIVDRAATA
jgi:hypothetical protein